jgi:preprotein translocase subunit Sec61beta
VDVVYLAVDYLHDSQYLRLNESQGLIRQYEELSRDVLVLKIILVICLIIIGLVIAVLIAFAVFFWKTLHPPPSGSNLTESEQNNKTKGKSSAVELPTIYNNKVRENERMI